MSFENNNFLLLNNKYSISPYVYITKKYFLKKKKIKYKKYRRLYLKNIYSELYSHKIYSLNYYINFFKGLNTNKLSKFNAYQFYFFNFSGLLKQFLIKDILIYSILWRKLKNNNNLAFQNNAYFYNKFSANVTSNFILSSNSKYYIKIYHTKYLKKINYYKNNLLILEKNEYLKNINYNNLYLDYYVNNNQEDSLHVPSNNYLNFVKKNNWLNLYYKRWWKALWNYNLKNNKIDETLEKEFFFHILNIFVLKYFFKKILFNHIILNFVIYKAYDMISLKKD